MFAEVSQLVVHTVCGVYGYMLLYLAPAQAPICTMGSYDRMSQTGLKSSQHQTIWFRCTWSLIGEASILRCPSFRIGNCPTRDHSTCPLTLYHMMSTSSVSRSRTAAGCAPFIQPSHGMRALGRHLYTETFWWLKNLPVSGAESIRLRNRIL